MDKHIIIVCFLSCLSFIIISCSHKNLYEAVQNSKNIECAKQPQSVYDECIDRIDKPYHEYEKEREILLKNGDSL
jgi:hypothetical protein